jgi:sterol desaturase/sphingolipid hydroxylase (fatty acid hydroxylase superfamily)
MTALTTNRHFWGDRLVKALTIWPLATMVMNPTDTIFQIYVVVSLYHYFVHANLKVDFGRWSWVLNSPAYHRRHHSKLPEHYDTNFAALFPIFDVICGTYRRPDGWPPCGQDEAPETALDLLDWPVRGPFRTWLRQKFGGAGAVSEA